MTREDCDDMYFESLGIQPNFQSYASLYYSDEKKHPMNQESVVRRDSPPISFTNAPLFSPLTVRSPAFNSGPVFSNESPVTSLKNLAFTLENLFMFASLGREFIQYASAGVHSVVDNPKVEGQKTRMADGKSRVVCKHTSKSGVVTTTTKPSINTYTLSKWEKKTLTIPREYFPQAGAKTIPSTIKGSNNFFRILDLHKFLQVYLKEGRGIQRRWDVHTNSYVEVRPDVCNTPQGAVYVTNGYTPKPEIYQNSISRLPRFEDAVFWARGESQKSPVSSTNTNPLEESVQTATVYLKETDKQRIPIFSETIITCGRISSISINGNRYEQNGGQWTHTGFRPDLGVWAFFTPQQLEDWHKNSDYKDRMAFYPSIEFVGGRSPAWQYTPPVLGELNGTGSTDAISVSTNATTVFLQAGKEYTLEIEIDNITTPLTLEEIPYIQCSFFPQPIKAITNDK